jgi:hypothetical protein
VVGLNHGVMADVIGPPPLPLLRWRRRRQQPPDLGREAGSLRRAATVPEGEAQVHRERQPGLSVHPRHATGRPALAPLSFFGGRSRNVRSPGKCSPDHGAQRRQPCRRPAGRRAGCVWLRRPCGGQQQPAPDGAGAAPHAPSSADDRVQKGGLLALLIQQQRPQRLVQPLLLQPLQPHTHTHSEREGGGREGEGGTERDTANKPLGCQSVSAAAHRLPVHTRWGAGALGRWGRCQRTSSVQPPPRPRAEAEQAADGHDASLLGNVWPLDRDGAPPPAVVAAAPRRTRTTPISPTRSTDSASGCSASCHAGRAQRATDDPPPCVHGWQQTPHNTDSKRRVSHV